MPLGVREPWNPWTTAILSSDTPLEPTRSSLGHPSIVASSPFIVASAWERDEDGIVQRVALETAFDGAAPSGVVRIR